MTESATRVDTFEPIPVPESEAPPIRRLGLREWLRQNLFSDRWNTLLTVVFAALAVWALYRVARFVFFDARWEIVERNLTNFMVFQFPRPELWRVWVALYVLSAVSGLAVGAAARKRALEVEEGRAPAGSSKYMAVRRLAPLVVLAVVLLVFARSPSALALVAGIAATALAFRFAGRLVPPRRFRWVLVAVALGIVASYLAVTAFGGVPRERWGGLLLTIYLAVAGITLSFPIGVLLALGRRSSFPAVRAVCIAYIELVRGVPLVTILFMAFYLGFFLPPESDAPNVVSRAVAGLVVFTSAYVAEIVRGGLQGVPRGQIEAAQAVGLSPVRTTGLIVLPQALRNVIPGLVGQFISLFKDTSLVFVLALTDLLAVAEAASAQRAFAGQGLFVETFFFVAFIYWAGSYWMSRESQRLELRLGVGVR
jgi:general L-amino acid transport system permease protein